VSKFPQASNLHWLHLNFVDEVVYSVRTSEIDRYWPPERLLWILETEGCIEVADPFVFVPDEFDSERGMAFVMLLMDITRGKSLDKHSHYEPAWGSA
jgi:hypothetical protein